MRKILAMLTYELERSNFELSQRTHAGSTYTCTLIVHVASELAANEV